MPNASELIAFTLICLAMSCTPGPNMIYLVSRSVSQGPGAGLLSLAGVGAGFLLWMLAAVLGLTALLIAVPFAYDGLRLAGAAYLLYLAWTIVRPGGRTPFETARLTPDRPARLFAMGLVTNLLNPKAAILYLSLLPQFIHPADGTPLRQGLALGAIQITVSMSVNAAVIFTAGTIARSMRSRPALATVQRWITGTVLGALALRMATDARR